VTEDRK